MSDASHCPRVPSPLVDYVRYGASVSRPPLGPAEDPSGPDADPHRPTNQGAAADEPRLKRPPSIVALCGIVAAEAAGLFVAAAWFVIQLVSGAPVTSVWGAVFILVLLVASSGWLSAAATFLYRGFRWPRAGALVAQLFVLTIGFPTLTGGYTLYGLAMLVPALAAIVLLFDKSVIRFASRAGAAPPVL